MYKRIAVLGLFSMLAACGSSQPSQEQKPYDEMDRLRAVQGSHSANYDYYPPGYRGPGWNAQGRPGWTGTCREYTQQVYVNGAPAQMQGIACERADGSWAPIKG